jgi:hypothetical protein
VFCNQKFEKVNENHNSEVRFFETLTNQVRIKIVRQNITDKHGEEEEKLILF